jgi:hypothetical protein
MRRVIETSMEVSAMLSVIVPALIIGMLALGPIAWRLWQDRRRARALEVRAAVHAAVRAALNGESLVSVHVEAPRPLRSGRVVLSVPGGWDWLIREAWMRVIAHVPGDYELVVRTGERPAAAATRSSTREVMKRAA